DGEIALPPARHQMVGVCKADHLDERAMRIERPQHLAALDVPEPDRAVTTAGDDDRAGRIERSIEQELRAADERDAFRRARASVRRPWGRNAGRAILPVRGPSSI